MSAPSDRHPADQLPYGADQPREDADNPDTPSASFARSRRGLAAPDWSRITEGTRFAGDVAVQQLREGRELDPDLVREGPPLRSVRVGTIARLAAVIVVAAAAAFIIVQLVSGWHSSRDQLTVAPAAPTAQPAETSPTTGVMLAAVDPAKSPPASVPKPAEAVAPRPPKAVLRAADEPNRTTVGEAVPLGLNVEGSTDGVVAIVTGLLPGSNLSVGNAVGPTAWHLPARDLARVLVRPPNGFSGTMEVVVDLQVGGDQIVDRRWRRLEWSAARTVKPAPALAPAPAAEAAAPARTIDPDEIAVLVRRGEQLIETGDLPSARLLLRRAAEAGDARAAFSLAGTYDPLVLSKLGVYGFTPDMAAARQWYQKAAEYGSREAAARLDMLASTGSR